MSSCNTKNQKLFKFISPEQSRITFNNTLIENDPLSILDNEFFYNGAGVALGDLNNDGLLDVFFTANQADNQLYLNLVFWSEFG
jgi:enediyne biosynthesis protein E4